MARLTARATRNLSGSARGVETIDDGEERE